MVGHGQLFGLCRVLHNYVATLLPYFKPTILFKKPEKLIVFHQHKGNKYITLHERF